MIYAVLNPPTGRARRRSSGRKRGSAKPRKGAKMARRLSAGARRMAALVKKYHGDFGAASRAYRSGRNPEIKGYTRKQYHGKGKKKTTKRVKASWRRWWPKRSKKTGRWARGRGPFSRPAGKYAALWASRAAKKTKKRKTTKRRRKSARNPMMTYNPLMTYNRYRRRRRSSRRRNPIRRYRRRYSRRRNPVALRGILAPVSKVFSISNVMTATWTAGGAFVTMSLPGMIRNVLPANMKAMMDKYTSGAIGGTLLDAVSAGLTAGLAGMLPVRAIRNRQKEIFAGAMLAVVIKAGARLLPQYWPLTMAATPLTLPGMSGLGQNRLANRALMRLNQGVQDYDTGMEDYDTGMEDYDTGMEDYGTGMPSNGSLRGLIQ